MPPHERRGSEQEDHSDKPRRHAIRGFNDQRAPPRAFFDLSHDVYDARRFAASRISASTAADV
jgi:hypothetical protein